MFLLCLGTFLCSLAYGQDADTVLNPAVAASSVIDAGNDGRQEPAHKYQRSVCDFQFTYIYQYKPAFSAPYTGANSVSASEEKQNSITATVYLGQKLWHNAAFFLNPEVAGGSGISGAFGMGGSTNGEAFRVGDPSPSLYLARAYVRQTFPIKRKGKDGEYENVETNLNELADNRSPVNYLKLFAGKFSMGDFFDNNLYANSPRTQFLNWALMNNGAWDYSANLRGYTVGFVGILKIGATSLKGGVAAEPKIANGPELNLDYGLARGAVLQLERGINIKKMPGHVAVLGFVNEANMGSYKQAIAQAAAGNITPDVTLSRKYGRRKSGMAINANQAINNWIGSFLRLGWNNGKTETWAFTEIDRTLTFGLNFFGNKWHTNDNIGMAIDINGLSPDHKRYLANGGLGFQLGDGRLRYRPETVTEIYYSHKIAKNRAVWLTADYQLAFHPGYNADRGPVNVFSLRAHAEI